MELGLRLTGARQQTVIDYRIYTERAFRIYVFAHRQKSISYGVFFCLGFLSWYCLLFISGIAPALSLAEGLPSSIFAGRT